MNFYRILHLQYKTTKSRHAMIRVNFRTAMLNSQSRLKLVEM